MPEDRVEINGDARGLSDQVRITRIQGRSIKDSAPADSDALFWDDTKQHWVPRAPTQVGGSLLAVEEEDGSPSVGTVNTVIFHQGDGFVVSSPNTGEALIELVNIPKSVVSSSGTWDASEIPDVDTFATEGAGVHINTDTIEASKVYATAMMGA